MFAVAMLWIGPEAASSPERMAELARDRRAAFITQDILKLASVAASLVVIVVLTRYMELVARSAKVGVVGAGLLGEAALFGNAALSLIALVGTATAAILSSIGISALMSLVFGGIWLILVNAIAWRHRRLPAMLCSIGIAAGAASLGVPVFPPVSLVALVLGITWSVWLGIVFWSQGQ
jgi:hypothetical protein